MELTPQSSSPAEPPSPEQLQRELELVRAAQPPDPPAVQHSVGPHLRRGLARAVILWLVLVGAFLAIWQFLVPGR